MESLFLPVKPVRANPSFSMPSVCSQENAHQRLSSGQGRKRSSLKARFFCPRKTKDWQTFWKSNILIVQTGKSSYPVVFIGTGAVPCWLTELWFLWLQFANWAYTLSIFTVNMTAALFSTRLIMCAFSTALRKIRVVGGLPMTRRMKHGKNCVVKEILWNMTKVRKYVFSVF